MIPVVIELVVVDVKLTQCSVIVPGQVVCAVYRRKIPEKELDSVVVVVH